MSRLFLETADGLRRSASQSGIYESFQSSRNSGIGGDNGLNVVGDALAQRTGHSARAEDADEAVNFETRPACLKIDVHPARCWFSVSFSERCEDGRER
jgi:hypothetical protein